MTSIICDVFISYSHLDKDWVDNTLMPKLRVAIHLSRDNLECQRIPDNALPGFARQGQRSHLSEQPFEQIGKLLPV